MTKTPLCVIRVAAFCLPLALVASCGSGSEAVQGTIVVSSPDSSAVTSTIDGTSPFDVGYVLNHYQITLRSPSGYAQVGTKVTITSSGILYDGFIGLDPPTTVSCPAVATGPAVCTVTGGPTPLSSVYEATTDSSGTVRVTLLFPFFSGSDGTVTVLEAFSGTSYGKTDIVFTCRDFSTTVTCP